MINVDKTLDKRPVYVNNTAVSAMPQINHQASLFADKPKHAKLPREESFQQFHEQNPGIYRILLLRALNMKRYGFTAYSMRTIWEVLRWQTDSGRIRLRSGEKWKLNDHYAPFYARLLMANHPELKGFFEVRKRDKTCSEKVFR